jgi:hypothetical protein
MMPMSFACLPRLCSIFGVHAHQRNEWHRSAAESRRIVLHSYGKPVVQGGLL